MTAHATYSFDLSSQIHRFGMSSAVVTIYIQGTTLGNSRSKEVEYRENEAEKYQEKIKRQKNYYHNVHRLLRRSVRRQLDSLSRLNRRTDPPLWKRKHCLSTGARIIPNDRTLWQDMTSPLPQVKRDLNTVRCVPLCQNLPPSMPFRLVAYSHLWRLYTW